MMRLFLFLSLFSLLFFQLACDKPSETNEGTGGTSGTSTKGPKGDKGDPGSFHAVDHPMGLTNAELAQVRSVNGWMNPVSNPIFVQGTVQLFGLGLVYNDAGTVVANYKGAGCKTAQLQIKWSSAANESWMIVQHFYVESRGSNTPADIPDKYPGQRYPLSFFLPPGGKVRVVENTDPNCRINNAYPGRLYIGDATATSSATWSYSPLR